MTKYEIYSDEDGEIIQGDGVYADNIEPFVRAEKDEEETDD